MAVSKTTHYLLRPYHMTDEEFNQLKESYTEKGIRVVVLREGEKNIHEGLKNVLLNHS